MTNDNVIVLSNLPGLDGIPGITCDIEINYDSPTETDDTGATVATALRALAVQIETLARSISIITRPFEGEPDSVSIV